MKKTPTANERTPVDSKLDHRVVTAVIEVTGIFTSVFDQNQVRSGQVVILKARPAMDAAVMSFHLSLSPTSSSSLTRFHPVVTPYNDKLALFKSYSPLSIHLCFGRPTGRFPVGFQL